VKWAIEMADEFEPEFHALHEDVRTEILAQQMVNGEWLSLLIAGARRFCSLRETNRAEAKSASTAN
jgi:hypothetical protein